MPKPMWLRGTSASPPCGNWVDQCVRGHGPGWWRTQTRPPKRVKDRPQGPSVSQMLHSFQCLVHTWGIPAPLSLPPLSPFILHQPLSENFYSPGPPPAAGIQWRWTDTVPRTQWGDRNAGPTDLEGRDQLQRQREFLQWTLKLSHTSCVWWGWQWHQVWEAWFVSAR